MKTVIEMAREAGDVLNKEWLQAFAELVRADEREACAQLCEDQWQTAHDIQDAIRARSKDEK